MKPVLTCCVAIASVLTAAENRLTPIGSTKHDRGLPAKGDLGDSSITSREMLVDISYVDGRPRKGAFVVFFDAYSGRYLWEFGPVNQREARSYMTAGYGTLGFVHIAADRLVLFAFARPFLVVHESFGKANSLDDAEAKALAEATGRLPAKLRGQKDDRVVIELSKWLPREFFLACDVCSGPGPSLVLNTTHKGNTWELILQGQWKQRVTLNNKYEVTGTARIN